jgi:hypothetical protein
MNDALQLYRRAQSLGLRVETDSGDLLVRPRSKCPPELVLELKQHKAELLEWLNRPPCPGWQTVPPDNLPLSPLPPRPTPANRGAVIAYLCRQTGGRPGPLCEWLVRREWEYYDGPGRKWDCQVICYAAARDAACWQLKRTEAAVWELLDAFAECAAVP